MRWARLAKRVRGGQWLSQADHSKLGTLGNWQVSTAYSHTMAFTAPSPHDGRRAAAPGDPASGLAAGWALLHEAGVAVAGLAQLGGEGTMLAPREFAMRAAAAGPARLALAEQSIDDCAAALHTGLTALIAGAEAGSDTTAAAVTLWREFDRARAGLLALTAPTH